MNSADINQLVLARCTGFVSVPFLLIYLKLLQRPKLYVL